MGHARTGGRIVVDALIAHGVERAFCVPGESFLGILDALYDERERIDLVTCRHEHGAGMMAEAVGKLTGRAGVCLVTRGPGACNASIAVHTAFQDSTPMLLLIGQVERPFLGREAFQEVDLVRQFQPLAKHAEQVMAAADLPRALARALALAESGRRGPVVLALPEDILTETTTASSPAPATPAPAPPDPGLMERLHRILGDADRPVMIVGGSGWTGDARLDLIAFAERNALPTCAAFRRQDIFDNDHPCFAGELGLGANPALVARIGDADLVLAVGTRLGEATSQGYTLFTGRRPELIHVHPDARELGRVHRPMLAIETRVADFARTARHLAPIDGHRHGTWARDARADYEADQAIHPSGDRLDLGQVMAHLRARMPADGILTVDAGNFSGWPQRYLRFGGNRRLLGATNGAMGYGVPAAIAAKLAHPERLVIAAVGDGGFGMTGQELSTAVARGAAIIVLVFNNGLYGTIRMHQERAYPGRPIATDLANPDYAALARAAGALGFTVERTDGFAPAFADAVASGRPAVIELRMDPARISTRNRLATPGD